uniref:Uncharacterized protein n=1 Tax=Lotharella oceanica TaxID=641309 RepID=A0A7S2TLR3_9EUKA|mmetsp:Transcript_1721/g.3261  ORF Transcript_1721/g.3261 Transcript_1721/m.3261 type:complete len:107 (+) Transcript_1721:64-384(+)
MSLSEESLTVLNREGYSWEELLALQEVDMVKLGMKDSEVLLKALEPHRNRISSKEGKGKGADNHPKEPKGGTQLNSDNTIPHYNESDIMVATSAGRSKCPSRAAPG